MRKTNTFSLRFSVRFVFWLTLALLLLFAVTPRGYAQNSEEQTTYPYKKTFLITSYYSPRPGQERYATGTYEGDVILNGEGDHSADGTVVYPGMIAAPSTFVFGTKMEIPGVGIGAVHDRGGAIKNNRLDIWVGYGDEGLRRALAWGMRRLEVTVYGLDTAMQEVINLAALPLADKAGFIAQAKYYKSDLGEGDSGKDVATLQLFLKQLGYYNDEITGEFEAQTREAVKQFQLKEGVIDGEQDPGAGNFGPRSRSVLENSLKTKREDLIQKLPRETLREGQKSASVKQIQETLVLFGFTNSVGGVFDTQTHDALLRFQIDNGVIENEKSFGAGIYGPKTQKAFQELIRTTFTQDAAFGKLQASQTSANSGASFVRALALNDRGSDVALLQEELRRLHFFGREPTGYYGVATEHAVFKFQQAFGVVSEKTDDGAGVVGPRTIEKLHSLIAARDDQKRAIAGTTEQKKIVAARLTGEQALIAGVVLPENFSGNIAYGDRGTEIERLQKILKRLGFFPGRLTTQFYGDITKHAILAFQKSHGLTESGNLDERTRKIINKILSSPQAS